MKTARELTDIEWRELIMYGRKLLFGRVIGPECYKCGAVASEVVVARNVSLSTNLEFLPVCGACKMEGLEDAEMTWFEEEPA